MRTMATAILGSGKLHQTIHNRIRIRIYSIHTPIPNQKKNKHQHLFVLAHLKNATEKNRRKY